MYQTVIIEGLVVDINAFLVSKSLSPIAVAHLAPQEALLSDTTIMYVVPDMYDLNLDLSTRRKHIVSLNHTKYVSVVYGQSYSELTDNIDIGPWAESKASLDLMEDLMMTLVKKDYSPLKVASVEFVRVDDTAIAHRRFLSSISIGFQEQC